MVYPQPFEDTAMINPHHPPNCHWHPELCQPVAVPEPSTFVQALIFLAGMALVMWMMNRRSK
jgi:hypothetical protein